MIVSAFLATIQGFLKAGSRARAAVPSEAGGGADDFLMIEEAPATMSRKAFWPRLSPWLLYIFTARSPSCREDTPHRTLLSPASPLYRAPTRAGLGCPVPHASLLPGT